MCCSWVNYRNLCCRPTHRWVKTGRSFMTRRFSTSSRSKRCRRGRSLSLWSRWECSLTLCTFPLTDLVLGSHHLTSDLSLLKRNTHAHVRFSLFYKQRHRYMHAGCSGDHMWASDTNKQSLANDKSVLLIRISKARFLLPLLHFLHGYLFRQPRQKLLESKQRQQATRRFWDFSALEAILIYSPDEGSFEILWINPLASH